MAATRMWRLAADEPADKAPCAVFSTPKNSRDQRKIPAMTDSRTKILVLAGLLGLAASHSVLAAPLLRCNVTYAGASQWVEATPVTDPYSVPSVDIGGRFRFKAVMVGSSAQLDRIVLYAYFNAHTDAGTQPMLIQQVKYLPPFKAAATPTPLTGEQRLYAGPAERELIYSCTLEGVQP